MVTNKEEITLFNPRWMKLPKLPREQEQKLSDQKVIYRKNFCNMNEE